MNKQLYEIDEDFPWGSCCSAPCCYQEPRVALKAAEGRIGCPMCRQSYSAYAQDIYPFGPPKNLRPVKKPDKIDVLNKGYVRLVDSMGSDLSVVRSSQSLVCS